MGHRYAEFDSSSERSKRRKTEKLRVSCVTSELAYAIQMSLHESGAPQASRALKDVIAWRSFETRFGIFE